jgi:membrane protease YdiL (CAAX protease family)
MLSAKSWKPEAIVRLVVSVFICVTAGSLLACLTHAGGFHAKAGWRLWLPAVGAFAGLATTLILLRRSWTLELFLRRTAVWLTSFYVGFFLAAWAEKIAGPPPEPGSAQQVVIGVLSLQGAGLLLTWAFLREHGTTWRAAFGFGNDWRRAVLVGIIVAGIFLPLAGGLQRAVLILLEHLPRLPLGPEEQPAVQALRIASSWVDRSVLGLITIVLAPVAEEILFRGILYPGIKQAGFPRLALWGTALLFAAVHVNFVSFLPLFMLALVLTVLYERTDNLLAPIAAHSLFNALNFAMLYTLEKRLS